MIISRIINKMIDYSAGNRRDINHFMKVWAYARTIGEAEKLDEEQQLILEIAAILHDIACPLCREKYGNTNGKYQEIEGIPLTIEFLKDFELSQAQVDRIAYLVGHHHTYVGVDGQDYQILLEADYIVNADEWAYSKENITNVYNSLFVTQTGKALLKSIYEV